MNFQAQLPKWDFSGDTVLLSAGANGIGRAMVQQFIASGACVVFGDIDCESGEELLTLLGIHATRAVFVHTDFGEEDAWSRMIAALPTDWNPTILISNAGIAHKAFLDSVSLSDYDRLHRINLRSAILGAKSVLPFFEKNGSGNILFTGSIMTHAIDSKVSLYTTTKAGLIGLMHALAVELAPKRIRVNAVTPGRTAVDSQYARYKQLPEKLLLEFKMQFAQFFENAHRQFQPLPEGIYPLDIAQAACFLCSPAARCITGLELIVDGGRCLKTSMSSEATSELLKWTDEMENWLQTHLVGASQQNKRIEAPTDRTPSDSNCNSSIKSEN